MNANYWFTARDHDVREHIPHTWASSNDSLFQSNFSVWSNCEATLGKTPNWAKTLWRFERALQRDVFRFRSFSTFRETTSERVMQFLSAAMAPVVNQSCREMTRLICEAKVLTNGKQVF